MKFAENKKVSIQDKETVILVDKVLRFSNNKKTKRAISGGSLESKLRKKLSPARQSV